jgi:hypothetical protein
MTRQQALVFLGLAIHAVELVRGRRAPAVVFSGVAFVFVLLDFVTLQQVLPQLMNTGLATVVVLLLPLSVVLYKSQLLEQMAERSAAWRWPSCTRRRACTRRS